MEICDEREGKTRKMATNRNGVIGPPALPYRLLSPGDIMREKNGKAKEIFCFFSY
jgi:hypothetical protein